MGIRVEVKGLQSTGFGLLLTGSRVWALGLRFLVWSIEKDGRLFNSFAEQILFFKATCALKHAPG